MKKNFVIVEIIPSYSEATKGIIVQIQALKVKNMQIVKRFDYRLNDKLVTNETLKAMISYDNDMFKYVNSYSKLYNDFKKFVGKNELLFLNDSYTYSYLKEICDTNGYENILDYLDLKYSLDVYDELIKKYHLEKSNHFVDLLYEALVYEKGE